MPAFREPAFWLPEAAPGQLIFSAISGSFQGATTIDLEHIGDLIADRREQDGRYFILKDEGGDFRGWLQEPAEGGIRCATAVLPIDCDFPLRLAVAQRFYRRLSGGRSSPLPRNLQLTMQRRARLALLVRVLDAYEAGARPRAIAAAFLDPAATSIPSLEWKSSALRRKAKQLIKEALVLRNGGYLKLLRGTWPLSGD